MAIGSSPVCQAWSTGRALAAGASEDEIAGALLGDRAGGRAGPGRWGFLQVAAALGYDTEAARKTQTHDRPVSKRHRADRGGQGVQLAYQQALALDLGAAECGALFLRP